MTDVGGAAGQQPSGSRNGRPLGLRARLVLLVPAAMVPVFILSMINALAARDAIRRTAG